MHAFTVADVTTIISAVTVATLAIIAAVRQGRVHDAVKAVAVKQDETQVAVVGVAAETVEIHREVKTINTLTVPQLIEAAESRRIVAIPEEDRTDNEKSHLADVPIPGKHDPPPGAPVPTDTGQPG